MTDDATPTPPPPAGPSAPAGVLVGVAGPAATAPGGRPTVVAAHPPGAAPPAPRPPRWPAPAAPAGAVALSAVTAPAVVAAVALPLDKPGIGWLLTAVAATAAVAAVSRRVGRAAAGAEPPARRPMGERLSRWGWSTATLALFGVGTLRAAGWLFALCVLTGLVTASLAVAGGRSVRGLAFGAMAVPVAALRSPVWVVRGLATVSTARGGSALRLLAAAGVGALLLLVFGALFAAADAAFAELLAAAFVLDVPDVVRGVFCFVVVAAGGCGAAYLLASPARMEPAAGAAEPRRLRRLEWALPIALLDALFAVFVAVQLAVLFGGRGHVLDTAGLTFAEYARGGFWQLLAVTVLTAGVLAAAARLAPRRSVADRVWLRVLLGALAALTLVVVASALKRMGLYQEAFGFTRLRLLVGAAELWFGAVLVLVLAAGVRLRGGWLPRAVVGTAVAALLVIAAVDPDRLIAERNVDRALRDGRTLDVGYLQQLSADAVPALDRLPEPQRSCTLVIVAGDLVGQRDGWRGYNIGRERARRLLAARAATAARGCAYEG